MTDGEVMILVFAPATVGLAVVTLRRLRASVYWSACAAATAVALAVLWVRQQDAGGLTNGPLAVGAALVVLPALAAFAVGRLQPVRVGGAWVFAAVCTAYLLALCAAVGIGVVSGLLVP